MYNYTDRFNIISMKKKSDKSFSSFLEKEESPQTFSYFKSNDMPCILLEISDKVERKYKMSLTGTRILLRKK